MLNIKEGSFCPNQMQLSDPIRIICRETGMGCSFDKKLKPDEKPNEIEGCSSPHYFRFTESLQTVTK